MNQDNVDDGYNGAYGYEGGNDEMQVNEDDDNAGPYPPPQQQNTVEDSDSDDCQFH